ncbi:hypothetical protein BAUCODRAFT_413041 [Baudoinia panamericana UAMH 10762]|uniref:Uncharacterized protein n=1 Tax=Baudoinia panamericana (strain UAMH 10762) TaxID=717646 RepID=M2NFS1_BAUPA|nr:uncharacterized protein BAUCODRAFT_413041 [Baudoinia panamericana UAMH 10762]EMC98109.1 hypothetical protein BAUCODRAFT_413041 [Baudoinia panamericana UAMH 10762]
MSNAGQLPIAWCRVASAIETRRRPSLEQQCCPALLDAIPMSHAVWKPIASCRLPLGMGLRQRRFRAFGKCWYTVFAAVVLHLSLFVTRSIEVRQPQLLRLVFRKARRVLT